MTLANKVTSLRLILAPVFFIIFLYNRFLSPIISLFSDSPGEEYIVSSLVWTVPVLWLLFIGSEITDLLDGIIARKRGEISDFGKLYDPFADTLTQLTYFFCFVIEGILPPILFLVVLYREFSVLFVRNQLLTKGITLAAKMGGKIKTVTYVLAGGLALAASSIIRLNLGSSLYRIFCLAAGIVFIISVILAIISFFDYVSILIKAPKKPENN